MLSFSYSGTSKVLEYRNLYKWLFMTISLRTARFRCSSLTLRSARRVIGNFPEIKKMTINPRNTPDRRKSKTLILSTNEDQKKKIETGFLVAICRPTGDKWQSKTLFLAIVDPRSLIVKNVFNCRISGVRNTNKVSGKCVRVGYQLCECHRKI